MRFLMSSPNILPEILPEYKHLVDTIKLIDVPKSTNGKILQVLMNADLDEAVGIFADPSTDIESEPITVEDTGGQSDIFWRWRYKMVERMALSLNPERFGVVGFYLFGSTKNASAGPGSDIDILIHFRGTATQLEQLSLWFNGWSLCLAEMNYMRTGYRSDGLLDIHIVTDDDIKRRTSYAAKIGAVTDPARPLPMKNKNKD
jgi:pyruvate, water dikinase